MATTRTTGFVITAAIWNAVLSGLNDAGNAFTGVSATLSGALSAASATLSGALSAASAAISGAVTIGTTLGVTGLASFTVGVRERGRSTNLGEEIATPFNAAHFDCTPPAGFTVQSTDVATNSYTLIGKQLFWHLVVVGASIATDSGQPVQLLLIIPGGFTSALAISGHVAVFSDGVSTASDLTCEVAAGGNTVVITRKAGGAFNNNTNSTNLYLHVRIPIQ